MEHASFGKSLLLAAGDPASPARCIGAVNGLIVVVSRVPDVIVTLTTGFIWGGVALLILEKPGGGAPPEFLNLGTGTLVHRHGCPTRWFCWSLPWRSSGFRCAQLEARPAHLRHRQRPSRRVSQRRECRAHAASSPMCFGGLFSAIGGLGLTMTTGIGSPLRRRLYTLSGLAAVVIGGVSLTGGRGGIVGPVIAAFVLTLIPADLIFLNIDPNFGQVIQGTLIVLVVMAGGLVTLAEEPQDERSAEPRRRRGASSARSAPAWFQRNTIVALILLLLLFIAASSSLKPGTVNPVWLSNTLLFAAPLGILAAGQTLVMLTGGIDLSVVSVATGSAFLMTTTASQFGNVTAVAIGLGLGLVVGAINGVGVALLRRSAAGDDARHRADDPGHHHRLQPEDPGVALDRAGLHPCDRHRPARRPHSSRPVLCGCRSRRW